MRIWILGSWDKDADGTVVYRRSDGPPGFRTGRACRYHALFAGNMEGNTTAPAADTVWINVGAVRGVAPELDF
jgi:hypothetical protein